MKKKKVWKRNWPLFSLSPLSKNCLSAAVKAHIPSPLPFDLHTLSPYTAPRLSRNTETVLPVTLACSIMGAPWELKVLILMDSSPVPCGSRGCQYHWPQPTTLLISRRNSSSSLDRGNNGEGLLSWNREWPSAAVWKEILHSGNTTPRRIKRSWWGIKD